MMLLRQFDLDVDTQRRSLHGSKRNPPLQILSKKLKVNRKDYGEIQNSNFGMETVEGWCGPQRSASSLV